jgi:hypothetical protein
LPLCFLSQRDPLKSANVLADFSNSALISDSSMCGHLYSYLGCSFIF